jgi:hypothetical protein
MIQRKHGHACCGLVWFHTRVVRKSPAHHTCPVCGNVNFKKLRDATGKVLYLEPDQLFMAATRGNKETNP